VLADAARGLSQGILLSQLGDCRYREPESPRCCAQRREPTMGRVFIGWFVPGEVFRTAEALTTPGNPEGDWGNAYLLAHPITLPSELICDYHAKRRVSFRTPEGDPASRFDYLVSIRNPGSAALTGVFLDW
jgi:hypothetical protein